MSSGASSTSWRRTTATRRMPRSPEIPRAGGFPRNIPHDQENHVSNFSAIANLAAAVAGNTAATSALNSLGSSLTASTAAVAEAQTLLKKFQQAIEKTPPDTATANNALMLLATVQGTAVQRRPADSGAERPGSPVVARHGCRHHGADRRRLRHGNQHGHPRRPAQQALRLDANGRARPQNTAPVGEQPSPDRDPTNPGRGRHRENRHRPARPAPPRRCSDINLPAYRPQSAKALPICNSLTTCPLLAG